MRKYLRYISLLLLITVFNSCGRLYCDVINSGPSRYCDNFYRRENEKAVTRGEGKGTYKSEEEVLKEGKEIDEKLRRLKENRERENQNKNKK